jgi:hypothetical protein
MRRLGFTAVSAILVSATIGSLSPAVAARYCLQGSGWGYPGSLPEQLPGLEFSASAERPPPARMPVAGSILAARSHANGGANSTGGIPLIWIKATCGRASAYDHDGDNWLLWGSKTNAEELFHATSSFHRRFGCSRAYSGRIKPRRRPRLLLLLNRRRLGLAGPLLLLDLPTMHGSRIRYPRVL